MEPAFAAELHAINIDMSLGVNFVFDADRVKWRTCVAARLVVV